ncbi:tail fiber domain-containing protein, partial [Patescibacteria group bacterium]
SFVPIPTFPSSQSAIDVYYPNHPEIILKNLGLGTGNDASRTYKIRNENKDLSIFYDNSASEPVFVIKEDGKVGIGTNEPNYKLDVAGDVGAKGYSYLSDRRLKKNIKQIENPVEKLMNLEGVSFNWKENNKKSIGFIAQDVEKVLSELVNTADNGIKSVQYGNVIALLVEVIKEQQKQIVEIEDSL